jgi:hypothetical protein
MGGVEAGVALLTDLILPIDHRRKRGAICTPLFLHKNLFAKKHRAFNAGKFSFHEQ